MPEKENEASVLARERGSTGWEVDPGADGIFPVSDST